MTELVNRSGAPIGAAAIDAFAAGLAGGVIGPGDAGYDAARRIWNAAIDRRPGLIARCRGAADVVAAVNFARANDLAVSVRGGGHNVAGRALCDDGLVIDLSEMRAVLVDPATATVRVEGGATLGDIDRETHVHGLAVPAGIVSRTGIAGLTLGGGVGWLVRRYGLTCDNVLAMRARHRRRRRHHRERRARTPTSSGRSRAAAATSASSPTSPSAPTRSRPSSAAWSSGRATRRATSCASTATSWRGRRRSSPATARWSAPRTARRSAVTAACWSGDIAEGEHVLAPLRGFDTAGRRHDPADALPGDAAGARRRLPRRHAQLLAGELRARADRRGDRHRSSSTATAWPRPSPRR